MKRLLAGVILLFSALLCRAYENPILKGFHPDPSICRVGEDYYLVNSSFQYFPGVPLYHSRDLVNWEQMGSCLDRPGQIPLEGAASWGGIYAPTIRHHDGVFYMISTNVSSIGNFIVSATDPAGPWSDPAVVDFPGIDPSLFFEGDKCYYTGTADSEIRFFEIDPSSGRRLSEPKTLWKGTGGRYPEGPHLYKKDGWYYLLIAEGGTEYAHKITIARSRKIDGPYEECPRNPIATHCSLAAQNNPIQGIGHADLVQTPEGDWWMVCLGFRTQGGNFHLLGRETFLAPVEWKDGWPTVNGDGQIFLDMPDSRLPENSGGSPESALYLRNPDFSNYSISEEGISLKAGAFNLDEKVFSPTFIAWRQRDIKFRAGSKLRFVRGAQGSEAGIAVYMDSDSHYEVFFRKGLFFNRIVLRYRLGRVTGETSRIILGRKAELEIEGSEYAYDFAFVRKGRRIRLGSLDTKYLSSETAGGFTGVVLGLFTVSPVSGAEANFDALQYESLDQ